MAQLPEPQISPVILTKKPQGESLDKQDRLFFTYLRRNTMGEKPSVDDFATFILQMFEYDEPERVIRHQKEMPFIMCGMPVSARPDISIMSGDSEHLLLVKAVGPMIDFEPNIIAEAIAASYQNNLSRQVAGRPIINSQTILGIVMFRGGLPLFYRIPVTAELVKCVEAGRYSPAMTIVQKCHPPIRTCMPDPDGLNRLDDRRIVMQCFEAFKTFL